MHADQRPERSPPTGEQKADTRDLWLVRDLPPSHEQDTEILETLNRSSPPSQRRFDWYGTDPSQPYASPTASAEFQQRLREITIRRAEAQAAQEEENLRASKEANRLIEQARDKDTRERSHRSTVHLLRSIALLIALTWTLTLLGLTSVGVRVTKFTPAAALRDATMLIKTFETAAGIRHHPHAHAPGVETGAPHVTSV